MSSEDLLPPPDERERLIGGLAKLIKQAGPQPLTSWPLVLPTNEFFPDAIAGTIGGLRRLLHRLLVYARLDDLNVAIEIYDSAHPYDVIGDDGELLRPPHHAAAWFAGIDEERNCLFGVDRQQLADREHLVGILCHEIAHAYRHHHALEVTTRDVEEELTDLTTVYLGFGILTTNGTYRYRSGGSVEGMTVRLEWAHRSAGYLSPEQMSFLMAVYAVVRKARRAIREHLEVTQQEMFDAAYRTLRREDLLSELGLPEDWNPAREEAGPVELPPRSDPNADPEVDDIPLYEPQRVEPGDNEGEPVFRVATHAAKNNKLMLTLIALAFGVTLQLADINFFLTFPAVFAIGWLVARSINLSYCASPECEAKLTAHDKTCPGCKGYIAGTITHPRERLQALEDLEDRRAS